MTRVSQGLRDGKLCAGGPHGMDTNLLGHANRTPLRRHPTVFLRRLGQRAGIHWCGVVPRESARSTCKRVQSPGDQMVSAMRMRRSEEELRVSWLQA